MEQKNAVLVFSRQESFSVIKTEYFSESTIPEELNGESGFHVYHVRTLTELILKELKKNQKYSYLTDKTIDEISMASSLHDIGKENVPKSILDADRKLSPVEYDIVKKHSVFGEEIIKNCSTDVDGQIISYAKQIARSHHERYDGSGYPDSIAKDEIPVCAQVVSIADAFDALTSERSYKRALSQDVAIEMIANGLCGVFQPILVECLLTVVNHNDLVKLRQQFEKRRTVVLSPEEMRVKRVLVAGNTGYVTNEFLNEAFERAKVTVVGQNRLKIAKDLKVYNLKHPSYEKLINTYDFDLVVYFSQNLTYGTHQKNDAQDLRNLLSAVAQTKKDAKIIYLSSLETAYFKQTDESIVVGTAENLCAYYSKNHSVNVKVVRIPYLYSGTNKNDFLYSIFESISKNHSVKMQEMAKSKSYFISMKDLSELIYRLIENFKSGDGILTVNDEFDICFFDIAQKICQIESTAKIDFQEILPGKTLKSVNKALRNEYGWFAKISILEELEQQYQEYLESTHKKADTLLDKIRRFFEENRFIVKVAELMGLFLITEFLVRVTHSTLHFSIVDFRTIFIVVMATIHGLNFGLAAAGLSSVSWFVAKIQSGTNWLTIFYEPTNWLSFVLFFLVGAVCGYVRLRSDDKIKEFKEQNEFLHEKLIFSRELYNDTFNEKKLLKKQIISSRDSFGKIYDVTRQLDTVEPRELYLKIINTFEDVLENKSICVYSVDKNAVFGRLEVASRDIMSQVTKSVSLEYLSNVIEYVRTNKIWKNTELKPGMPMYAAGVQREGKLELLIFIWHTNNEQRSLYYVNLFKILCDLAQMSLFRAYDYSKAVYSKQYIQGTRIMNSDAFEKILNNFMKMAEKKVFSYVCLKIKHNGMSFDEIDKKLAGLIRVNDVLGLDKNENVCVLLSQATKQDLPKITPRFENRGVEFEVL